MSQLLKEAFELLVVLANCLAFIFSARGEAVSGELTERICNSDGELDEQCGAYTYRVVKPLLKYTSKITDDLEKSVLKDNQIKDLKDQQKTNEAIIRELRIQINSQQNTIDKLITNPTTTKAANSDQVTRELASKTLKLEECENQLMKLNTSLIEKVAEMSKLNVKAKKDNNQNAAELNKSNQNNLPNSCSPSGLSQGVHQIKVSGIDPFYVLCDHETAGHGWLVIQQRINGIEDFNRDWTKYRDGFGAFQNDFFLGLEKIHQLTISQRYELYIYMENYKIGNTWAHYDDFHVGSESEGYKLSKLGKFNGNTLKNNLALHEGNKFSTYDRDNDNWDIVNCARDHTGGWWFGNCGYCNLNGKFINKNEWGMKAVYWEDYNPLKKVKMLIRPWNTNNKLTK